MRQSIGIAPHGKLYGFFVATLPAMTAKNITNELNKFGFGKITHP